MNVVVSIRNSQFVIMLLSVRAFKLGFIKLQESTDFTCFKSCVLLALSVYGLSFHPL